MRPAGSYIRRANDVISIDPGGLAGVVVLKATRPVSKWGDPGRRIRSGMEPNGAECLHPAQVEGATWVLDGHTVDGVIRILHHDIAIGGDRDAAGNLDRSGCIDADCHGLIAGRNAAAQEIAIDHAALGGIADQRRAGDLTHGIPAVGNAGDLIGNARILDHKDQDAARRSYRAVGPGQVAGSRSGCAACIQGDCHCPRGTA